MTRSCEKKKNKFGTKISRTNIKLLKEELQQDNKILTTDYPLNTTKYFLNKYCNVLSKPRYNL